MRLAVVVVVVAVAVGCSGPSGRGSELGGTDPDAGLSADSGPTADGGMSAVQCPMRTAPVGEPQGPVAADEIWDGDLVLDNVVGDTAVGIRVVTGDLTIRGGALPVVLPDLEVVGGALWLGYPDDPLVDVALPALETVDGDLEARGENLVAIALPRLESVGANLRISQAEALANVDLSCLTTVGGVELGVGGTHLTSLELPRLETAWYIAIGGNPQLESIELPALVNAKRMDVVGSPALLSVSAPLLASLPFGLYVEHNDALETFQLGPAPMIATVRFDGNPNLSSLALPGLTDVESFLLRRNDSLQRLDGFGSLTTVGYMEISENELLEHVNGLDGVTSAGFMRVELNPVLTSISMANVETVGGLDLQSNAALESIGFGALESVTGNEQQITNNPLLPSCQAEALRDRVTYPEGTQWYIGANDDEATCP